MFVLPNGEHRLYDVAWACDKTRKIIFYFDCVEHPVFYDIIDRSIQLAAFENKTPILPYQLGRVLLTCQKLLTFENPMFVIHGSRHLSALKSILRCIERDQLAIDTPWTLFFSEEHYEHCFLHEWFKAYEKKHRFFRYHLSTVQRTERYDVGHGLAHHELIDMYPDLSDKTICLYAQTSSIYAARAICFQHGAHPKHIFSNHVLDEYDYAPA